MIKKLARLLIGESKDPLDSRVFHQISLVAFLAWVGLGADGLSSSAYGPEEAYRALPHGYEHLALYVAVAMAITVAVICASYSQLIALFPGGGGGYLVTSKLLGAKAGLVAGSALVVDYIFTISISIAAGADAIFSFLPPTLLPYKLSVQILAILVLIWLNLRGMKESIQILLPIFLLFIFAHLLLITAGILGHAADLPNILALTLTETHSAASQPGGVWALTVMLFTAYSMGGGTYTGIEAISNGMGGMREPRVRTGRRAMLYTGLSLAFAASGLLVCYMLWDIQHQPGKTMNASLAEAVFGSWSLAGVPVGQTFVWITMTSAAMLLFVASQTGFLGGAAVLSNMAADSWVPHQFANLSNRLVTRNGILGMGLTALAINFFTNGRVDLLVVMYAVNVFLGFCLSQLGMCVHWWRSRAQEPQWKWRILVNGTGLVMTTAILAAMVIVKFAHGAWFTMVITGILIALCVLVNRHYRETKNALRRLDDLLINLPIPEVPPEYKAAAPEGPTAVLLVNGYNGLGIHAIFSIRKLFKHQEFRNLLFVSVGQVDSARFKGVEEMENLKVNVQADLARYVDLAQRMGYYSEYRFALGTDRVAELEKLCTAIADDFVEPIIFCGKLVFAEENNLTRILHNQTAMEIQRKLMFAGLNTIVVPVRVL